MDNEKLNNFLSSTAIVIDDEIIDKNSSISAIINELSNKGTMFVMQTDLPDSIQSISNVSYIILDWDLKSSEEKELLDSGVIIPDTLKETKVSENINFVLNIINNFFIPIFVFSQENTDMIKNKLEENDTIKEAITKRRVLLHSKGELTGDKICEALNNWLNESSAVYTYKILDEAIEKAKHRYFNEMDTCDPNWPCYVYQTLKEDNPADINSDFQEFLLTSFTSTIDPILFDANGFDKTISLNEDEIRKIYSRVKFLTYKDSWGVIGLHPGDLYMHDEDGAKSYVINTSAACDMRKNKCYFISGNEVSSPRKHDIVCTYTIKHILDLKGIEFHLDDGHILSTTNDGSNVEVEKNGNTIKYQRIGRLLNPYINALQIKYANYIVRAGSFREP